MGTAACPVVAVPTSIFTGHKSEAKVMGFDKIEAQHMVNTGAAWLMEGSLGRATMAAIEAGTLMLGREAAHDYYGNHIPSRDDVVSGTKGSRAYVAERMGEEYAAELEAVP